MPPLPAPPPARSTARPAATGALLPTATLACSVALLTGGCRRADPAPPTPAEREVAPPAEEARGATSAPTQPAVAERRAAWPERAAAAGLDYVNVSGEAAKATILEANGAGVAVLDLGGDGDLDLVFAQGLPRFAQLLTGPGADLEVFLGDGQGNFRRTAGPGLSGWWTGLATGDLDGDGRTDLVAGGYGDLVVLLQDEAGELRPLADSGAMPAESEWPGARLVVGAPREPGPAPLWCTSLATLDVDRDGVLDLYVGQYLDLDPHAPPLDRLGEGALALPCVWKGLPVYCGPRGMVPQPDRVLRGLGGGRFEDRSAQWLPDHEPGFTLGVLAFDADGDLDTDVYVANDSVPNLLLINQGGRELTDVAATAGVAVNQDGAPEAGMGTASGDIDRDGRLDLVVTNFSDEPTQVYFASTTGFRTETYRLGLGHATRRLLSWGVHLIDFDGDGWLELFTANGHVYPQADEPHTGTRYGQPNTLWRLGPGARAEAIEPDGPGSLLAAADSSRGTAVGDFDGDGAPDLVVVNIDGPATLGLNRSGREARRLVVRLEGAAADAAGGGPRSPRDGRGARVVLVPETPPGAAPSAAFALLGELHTAQGYQSASAAELYFGLGPLERFARLEVHWPSGVRDVIEGGAMGRRVVIGEGRGELRSEPLRSLPADG